ncbi:MAG TPA: PepSY domain-containing protein [Candidatus Binatia bacterium]|nr:PepSY domain-containing protein [Candidatus Binatia bacterium]
MERASLASARCAIEAGSSLVRAKHTRRKFRGVSATAISAVLVLLTMLASCSSEPEKPAEQAKPEVKGPELLTARSGFQKLYVAARGWNQDAKPYRLESIATSDGNGHDGKWAVWRAGFASATQRLAKTYTWSGSTAEGAPSRGINFGIEDSYSPTNASMQTWDIQFLKIDSDQALATAQKHGGDKILEKTPDTPVTYVCDWNRNTNQLIWHVIFGTGRENSKLTVSVDASTGEFIRVEK